MGWCILFFTIFIGLVFISTFFHFKRISNYEHQKNIKLIQKRFRLASQQIRERNLCLDRYHFLSYNLEEVLVVQKIQLDK
ncbi:MAG: hypothetical protein CMH15_16880 [Mesonia sp.]|nr:hypothetical protein [Mesonia sp.]MAQ42685.1 hypothetical protein [Mesonia sp.]|tara:strand:+ start:279 stop:518 length:240 start_codon:yes stop_codon:yes gene_type:complete